MPDNPNAVFQKVFDNIAQTWYIKNRLDSVISTRCAMRIIRTIIFCTCVVVSLTGTAFSVYRNKNINIAYETHKPLPIEVSQNLLDIRPEPLALELPAQEASLPICPN